MRRDSLVQNTKGFSLAELITVLALLGIVLASIYTLYFSVHASYDRNDARSAVNHQMNRVFMQMDKDIRSASKPNYLTSSVRVVSSNEMHIYAYDEKEGHSIRIAYQFIPNSKLLQRGWIACETEPPPATENPPYGMIDNWETIMVGAVEKYKIMDGEDETEAIFGFEDVTDPPTNPRREIRITLIGNDTNRPLNKSIIIVKNLTSRSSGFQE